MTGTTHIDKGRLDKAMEAAKVAVESYVGKPVTAGTQGHMHTSVLLVLRQHIPEEAPFTVETVEDPDPRKILFNIVGRTMHLQMRHPNGESLWKQHTGIKLIIIERQRQIDSEGWDAAHDDEHTDFELSYAACCYAQPGDGGPYDHTYHGEPPPNWPWDEEWWKPADDPIRNLTKAGALIAAEIDRIQRKKGQQDE